MIDRSQSVPPLPRLTVWYNTRCPVCDAGITWQKKRLVEAVKAGTIAFRDINDEPEALTSFQASIDDVRRRLHGLDQNGVLHVGTDCAVEIWRRTPGHSLLAAIVGVPVIRSIAGFGYNRFADILFAWNRSKGRW